MEATKTPKIVSKDPVKFTDEEIAELEVLKVRFNELVLAFGRLHIQKMDLASVEQDLVKEKTSIEAAESAMMAKIVEKYGEGTFDPKTNVFTPKA